MDKVKVAIKGVSGAFHDLAARKYFTDCDLETIECDTFELLCQSLQSRSADKAVMAIENSISGSILPNFNLLDHYNLIINGEIYLRIHLNLMALPGTKTEDLQVVESHPMALAQCQKYMSQFPQIRLVEGPNTARCAKFISTAKRKKHGAIASLASAELYNLEILAKGIETNKHNYTRFLILTRKEEANEVNGPNKASLTFQVAHSPGALVKALNALEANQLNMTKIQSVPVIGEPNRYSFHCDVEWLSPLDFSEAIHRLHEETSELKVLGVYKNGGLIEA